MSSGRNAKYNFNLIQRTGKSAQHVDLTMTSAQNQQQVQWLPIALTVALCFVTIGPGALSFDLCVIICELTIAVSLAVALFTARFKGAYLTFDIVAISWFCAQAASTLWSFHTPYFAASPYSDRVFGGGEYGLLTHLGDIAASIGLYLLSSRSNSGSSSHRMLPILACAIGVAALASVEEIRNITYGTVDPRIQATFTNPNLLGAFVCIALPVTTAFAIERSVHLPHRVLRGVLTKSMIAVLILTQSRGAILGCVAGCLFVIFASVQQHSKRFQNRILPAFVGAVLVLTALTIFVLPHVLHQGRSVSDAQRETAWMGAVEIIKEHPITGLGYGSYPAALSILHLREPNPDTVSGLPLIPSIHLHAHNILLESWVEGGILEAAVVILIVLLTAASARKMLLEAPRTQEPAAAVGALGAIIATLCQNTPDYTLWYTPISMLFWFMMGYASHPETAEISEKIDLRPKLISNYS